MVPCARAGIRHKWTSLLLIVLLPMGGAAAAALAPSGALRENAILVTWYGNPHSPAMGVLGQDEGAARAAALQEQARQYEEIAPGDVLMAYHLVAVVAQPAPGADGMYRRREQRRVIQSLLDEGRAFGIQLVLDIQPGRSPVRAELEHLREFLQEPDVHVALDPEFTMAPGEVPGQVIGQLHADQINAAVQLLDDLVARHNLPPKILILHQFTHGMLPDKEQIEPAPGVQLALMMDGIGSPALKRHSYRSVMRQHPLEFAGFKIFYEQDTRPMSAEDVFALSPAPAVITYQ